MRAGIRFQGHFRAELVRDGIIVQVIEGDNAVVDIGINTILDVMFHAASQTDPWYVGLIGSAIQANLLATDTMTAHPNWTENQSYTELVRQTWVEDAAAGKSITNTTLVAFSINATTTISGIFLTSDNVKGGATGILWATGLFTEGDVSAQSGDTLNVTYTITGAAA